MTSSVLRAIVIGKVLALAGVAHAGTWTYDSRTDEMTSKTVYVASSESVNSLNLDFPYQGINKGRLSVRQHPKFGLDVYVEVQKGQILCRSYDGCSIAVRFDDKPAVMFEGANAADHSSEIVFLRNEKKFIAEAKKAKVIRVQLTMYQSGTQVLVFETPNSLEWPVAAPKKK